MTDLSMDQWRVIWTRLGKPDAFATFGADSSDLQLVFARPWIPGYLLMLDESSSDPWALIEHNDLTLVLIRENSDAQDHEAIASQVFEHGHIPQESVKIFWRTSGRLIDPEGREISATESAQATSVTNIELSVTGRESQQFKGRQFPLSVPVELAGEAETWVVEVSGIGLPPAVRARVPEEGYNLTGSDRLGQLVIDVAPQLGGDRWIVRYRSAERDFLLQTFSLSSDYVSEFELDNLAVVFDRTCPDQDSWAAARSQVLGLPRLGAVSKKHDPYAEPEESTEADSTPTGVEDYEDFNEQIREAVGAACEGLIASANVSIHAWWFADTAGDGMGAPDDVELPEHDFGSFGLLRSGDAELAFDAAYYSPGLDIWDPLDQAADAAVSELLAKAGSGRAVMIVGNSPPPWPSDLDSPLRTIGRHFGHATTYRRSSPLWDETLQRCREHGVRVVYLFLTHRIRDRPLRSQGKRFNQLMRAVESALASQLDLIPVPATGAGVEQGFVEALDVLKRNDRLHSSVSVAS